MIVPFEPWEPDNAFFNAPAASLTFRTPKGVVPTAKGYRTIKGWEQVKTGTVDDADTITNAFSAKDGFRTVDTAGDTAKLYQYDSTGNTVYDNSSGTYTTQTGDHWDFTQFGNQIIAVNGGNASADVPQTKDVTAAIANNFAALGGSPPRASTVDTLKDFVVMGHTYDATDGERPERVWWSGFGDETSWTPSAATQGDIQDLKSTVGAVQRILGGDYAFIVCQKGTVVMRYEGPPTVMAFDYAHPEIGTEFPLSAVRVGGYVYMYAKNGFVRLGSQPGDVQYIGSGRTNIAFDDALAVNLAGSVADRLLVRGCHDPYNQMIWWSYDTDSGDCIGYSYAYDRWVGSTLADRGPTAYPSDIGGGTGNSRVATMTGFNLTDNTIYSHTAATTGGWQLPTGFMQMHEGRRTLVTGVRPVVEYKGTVGDMRLLTFALNDPVNTSVANYQTINQNLALSTSDGRYECLTEGRFIKFVLTGEDGISGAADLYALDVEAAAATGRF